MADLTASDLNTALGTNVFDDNGGTGPLTLNLDALTGDSLTLASNLAEPVFKLLKAVSEAAAGVQTDPPTATYPAIVRSIQTVDGNPVTRLSATVNVAAPIQYDEVTAL